MNRGYLVLGAAVVLAAVIGLYAALGRSDDARPGPAAEDQKISDVDRARRGVVPQGRPVERARPTLPEGTGAGPRDYMVGDVHVRDHRSGEHAPLDVPPAIHPPEGRKVPSQLTSDLAQRIRTVVNECAASVPREARGASPRLDGEISMSIKNRQATVTAATFQARDVAAPAQDQVKLCMEQRSIGVATPSGDEPDVEGYAITLSFRLP